MGKGVFEVSKKGFTLLEIKSLTGFTLLEIKPLTGFTLIELVIVLSILAILSVVVTPAVVSSMRRSQLNACAEQLAAHIRYARSVAMAGGLPSNPGEVQIIFTTGTTQKYEVKSCSSGSVFLKDPLTSQNFSVTLNDLNARREFAGITFAAGTTPPNTGTGLLVFSKNGKAYTSCSGSEISSTDQTFVRLQNQSGQTLNVYVMRSTGAVYVEAP